MNKLTPKIGTLVAGLFLVQIAAVVPTAIGDSGPCDDPDEICCEPQEAMVPNAQPVKDEIDDALDGDADIQVDCLPLGTSTGTSGDGAGSAVASCDLLATACAAALAAVTQISVEATGTIPYLGEGSIKLEASFGMAVSGAATRVILSATRYGETEVTSHFEEEQMVTVQGDDDCQWYNPFDWAGHCDPDKTVAQTVESQSLDENGCLETNDAVNTPGDLGDWKFMTCDSHVVDGSVCMDAAASATAFSDSPTGKETVDAKATNCDKAAAQSYFEEGLGYLMENSATSEPSASGTVLLLTIGDLPVEAVDLLRAAAGDAMAPLIDIAISKMNAPYEVREEMRSALEDALNRGLADLAGTIVVRVLDAGADGSNE